MPKATLKDKASKIVVERGQIVKLGKDAKRIVKREVLTKQWTDWIDYWAVDFNFESKREIIRVRRDRLKQANMPGMETASVAAISDRRTSIGDRRYNQEIEQLDLPEYEEMWTGDYIFENEWQSFRTKKDRSLELTSVYHECQPGAAQAGGKGCGHFRQRHHDHCRGYDMNSR
jgi:hypothetical protein